MINKRVITFGTFDLLHEGHINILKRASKLGNYLIVGVSSDKLNAEKGKNSIFTQDQRLSYIKELKCVDEVFLEDSLELKNEYITKYNADLLVMGDDWSGKFDWVSCETKYLARTENISTTKLKTMFQVNHKPFCILFADTYIDKHYDCALTLLPELINHNIIPIITKRSELPRQIDCNCLVYFNKPVLNPPSCYDHIPKILIDHGASNLKWFLGSSERFFFFDQILTAGPDHVKSLLSFFPIKENACLHVESVGFIKSKELLANTTYSRNEICKLHNLDPQKKIILFAPTYHKSKNKDITEAINQISKIKNHIASLHPETENIDTSTLNLADNKNNMTLELLKHSDIVISDTSSVLFEAAALNKSTVQLLLAEYPDNSSILYDFPYTAGTCDLFCSGLYSRPAEITEAINNLNHDSDLYNEKISLVQKRVIDGTHINDESIFNIIEKIVCVEKVDHENENRNIIMSEGSSIVEKRKKIASNRLIAHAGGKYKGISYSNSKEAIFASLDKLNFVEIDLVNSKDGIIIANDGLEKKYSLSTIFENTLSDDFIRSKFENKLSPISLKDLISVVKDLDKYLVCDIKEITGNYKLILNELLDLSLSLNGISNIVVQCYCVDDFNEVLRLGFENVILAVWKYYYKDPLGFDSINFIKECYNISSSSIIGISIPYQNKFMELPSYKDKRFFRLYSFFSRIYIHGAPIEETDNILNQNLGLFINSLSNEYEIKDIPKDFNWIEYIFLNENHFLHNSSNQIYNQVAASIHYLKYGEKNKGKYRYRIPKSFNWINYLKLNRDLQRNGITGENSAKAHWTNFGKDEKRKYT